LSATKAAGGKDNDAQGTAHVDGADTGALNPAFAGGPVVVEDDVEMVEAKPASSGGILLPLLLLAVVVAVATGGGDDDAPPPSPSDMRLKEDVRRVGTNHLGLGVYQYRYKGMAGVWEGVMAQEVEVMHPAAIKPLPYGFKAVDYAQLGLTLRRVH
jgi:Chaperone of endosialidase